MSAPTRIVHCTDAIGWLREQPVLTGCSIVTSLPDVSELGGVRYEEWRRWFHDAAALIFARTPDEGAALFYQSDVKRAGTWVDKGYLVQRAAEQEGFALLFHKIVCRVPAGTRTSGRAGYGHLLCFAKILREDLSRATPDVLAQAGEMTWVRAIGLDACRIACRWVAGHTATRTIVDPFCGVGTVLAVANEAGLDAVGVELNKKRAQKSRGLTLGGPGVAPG